MYFNASDQVTPPRKRRRVDDVPRVNVSTLSSPIAAQSTCTTPLLGFSSSLSVDNVPEAVQEDSASTSHVSHAASCASPWSEGSTTATSPELVSKSNQEDSKQRSDPDCFCFGMLTDLSATFDGSLTSIAKDPVTPVVFRGETVLAQKDPDKVVAKLYRDSAKVLSELQAQKASSCNCNPTLSVIIYGTMSQYEAVGRFLEVCELHLQDPKHCDRNVEYNNPQSLVPRVYMTQETPSSVVQELQTLPQIADFLADLETGDGLPETQAPPALRTDLFHHQKQALTFMIHRERGWALHGPQPDLWCSDSLDGGVAYRNTITNEIISDRPPDFQGGILADQMGLGKTLSIIALIASDKDGSHSHGSSKVHCGANTTLLVVRAGLLKMWQDQMELHIFPNQLTWRIHHEKTRIISSSQISSTDIVLTTYHTLMTEWKKNESRPQTMFKTRWRRIVLDEAHDISNGSALTTKAICALEADARWALTGTPIQNRMSDLGSLYKFLRIYPYDNARSFSSLVDKLVHESEQGIEKLKRLIGYTMLRRSIATVKLPARQDMVSKLEFSAEERAVYKKAERQIEKMLEDASLEPDSRASSMIVLGGMQKLLTICNLGTNARLPDMGLTDDDGDDWGMLAAQNLFNTLVSGDLALCGSCKVDLSSVATEVADTVQGQNRQPLVSKCARLTCGTCSETLSGKAMCEHQPPCPTSRVSTLSSNIPSNPSETRHAGTRVSTKVQALLGDLNAHVMKEKSVVFSFWISTLDHIKTALDENNIRSVRIIGDVSKKGRDAALQSFHRDESVRVALLTISCGAVGLNLTCASRAYLMEPRWNPSVEQQALARVYRMGQTRPVTTIRYIMRDSFEEYVLNVQRRKLALTEMLMSSKDQNLSGAEKIELFRSSLAKTKESGSVDRVMEDSPS